MFLGFKTVIELLHVSESRNNGNTYFDRTRIEKEAVMILLKKCIKHVFDRFVMQ